jgi:hypothetical protein
VRWPPTAFHTDFHETLSSGEQYTALKYTWMRISMYMFTKCNVGKNAFKDVNLIGA